MNIVVGIGECAVSGNQKDIITTHALASCVAVSAYSPSRKVAGMIHILLPSRQKDREQQLGPFYYAITGIPIMIDRMCSEYGCKKGELIVRLFGGADSIRDNDVFCLGKRNIIAVLKVLTEMNLKFDASETGGLISRTLEMNVDTGKVSIKSQPMNI